MNKSILLLSLLVFLFVSSACFAQVNCQDPNFTTNPDITGGWDWRYNPTTLHNCTFTVWFRVDGGAIATKDNVQNPFCSSQNQENVYSLAVNLDYEPSDGWELVSYYLSTHNNPIEIINGVPENNPRVVWVYWQLRK